MGSGASAAARRAVWARWGWRSVAGLYVAHGLVVAAWAALRLNVVPVDLAGHIASAAATWDGAYHEYSDAHFLGYVHGLFYPPLEDFVLGALQGALSWEIGYPAYLAALWSGFLACAWQLGRRFAPRPRAAFLLGFLWLVTAPRDGILYQGLSIWDLLTVGLSAQILGGAALLGLLAELFAEAPRTPRLVAWLTAVVAAHLVMGLFAVAVVVALLGAERRSWPQLVRVGAWSAALTATFWLPFLAYRAYTTASSIAPPAPTAALVGAAVVVAGSLVCRHGRALALLSLAFVAATYAAATIDDGRAAPAFHYYRLSLPTLLLILVAGARAASSTALGRARWAGAGALVVVLALVTWELPPARLARLHLDGYQVTPTDVGFSLPPRVPDAPFGRQWTIENRRAHDFGLDSMLAVETERGAASVKGLYWESSRNNTLLASYLASLHSAPVVLDHLVLDPLPCPVQRCLMESFARTYNVRRIAYDRALGPGAMRSPQRACLREIDRDGRLATIDLAAVGNLRDQEVTYTIFDLVPGPTSPSLDVAELIAPAQLMTRTGASRRALLATIVSDAAQRCAAGGAPSDRVFVSPDEFAHMRADLGRIGDPPAAAIVSATRIGPGAFDLDVPSAAPAMVWIKLNYLPGMTLRDAAGARLPLYDAFPGMIGVGAGRLHLRYERPGLIIVAEATSALAALAALGGWGWRRRRRRLGA